MWTFISCLESGERIPLKLRFVLTSAILHPPEKMQTKNALVLIKIQFLLHGLSRDCNSEHGYGISHCWAQCSFRSGEWIVTTSRRLCADRGLPYCRAHFPDGKRGLALLS